MSWAEVMKINSDMTTPLNENYTAVTADSTMRILFEGNKQIGGSQTVSSPNPIEFTVDGFKSKIAGACFLNVQSRGGEANRLIGQIAVVKNGVQEKEYDLRYSDTDDFKTDKVEFDFKKGDEISFKVSVRPASGHTSSLDLYYTITLSSMKITGTIVSGTLFDDLVEG